MTPELDAKIAALRQRRGRAFAEAEAEAARLIAAFSEQAEGIRSELASEAGKITGQMASVQCQVQDAETLIGNLVSGSESLAARLDANEASLRRQARRAGQALGFAIVAAGTVILVAIWAGVVLVQERAPRPR
ncbi:MAG: hypothetical protein HC844_00950 [Tabrizicola sp.]|nr:hypothetical protein [Tabrizicola sp.]